MRSAVYTLIERQRIELQAYAERVRRGELTVEQAVDERLPILPTDCSQTKAVKGYARNDFKKKLINALT